MFAPIALVLLSLLASPRGAAAEQPLYVRHAGILLRAEPSLGARVVGPIPARAKAVLLSARSEVEELEGVPGRWAKVKVGEKEGWVFDRNLSFVEPLSSEQTRRALLKGPVECERTRLKLKADGSGIAVSDAATGPAPRRILNVHWWGDDPFYVVFETWRSGPGGLAQEGLALCELEYVDARELFEGLQVDLRRRAPDTMSALGLDSECRGAATDDGCPALVTDVVAGRAAEAKALLDRGADPNATTRWGWTALHHASRLGRAELAELLLARGASPRAKGRDGSSPLHLAAGAGQVELVGALLAAGADAADPDREGRTPLHWAAGQGHAKAVAALLAHGAPADSRDFHGWPALSYAARRGHLEAIRTLLAGKASPNARDRDDATALHAAAAECAGAAVELLLARGSDPALRDRYGLTPLHHAYFARCAPVPAGLEPRK
ncbi:MAG: ankyrin repeat domain-containing protein [Myxococcales bacterium]